MTAASRSSRWSWAGTTSATFARSHTGALATSWRTTRAALRQAGAVLVDDERELVDAVAALSLVPAAPHARPGVGVRHRAGRARAAAARRPARARHRRCRS